MPKRFTDNEKWKKPFLRAMKAPYKLLWLYLLDECDHAGIWQVDFQIAEIKIGEKLKSDFALEQLNGKIIPFQNGEKWFIPDFIDFQYGALNPANRVHFSVISLLRKYELIDDNFKIKGLTSTLEGAKAKDKDKDKEKEKDKDIEPVVEKKLHEIETLVLELKNVSKMRDQLTYENCVTLSQKYPFSLIEDKLRAMNNKIDLTKKYISVYDTLNNWCRADFNNNGEKKHPYTEHKKLKTTWD